MSGDGAGEKAPQTRRRRINPKWAYPEVDALLDDYGQISALAPSELRRYSGMR